MVCLMKLIITVCLLFAVSMSFYAQTEIRGVVMNEDDKKVMPGVNVMIQEKSSGGVVGYALTDNKGNYKINFDSKLDSVIVAISGFNVKKESRAVANRNQEVNFKITAQAIQLKEVKVTPPRLRQSGDTINYLVDGFVDQNDRTIGDALRKMPGIEVKESGQVLYNNQPVNKVYIENMDMLQGRYGVAINNIRAKDVASVQVLENHQPIKALKDKIISEQAAINLKLKDSAKGVITANAMLGAGFAPFLWNNELFSMYFAKNKQSMGSYKGNNTGDEVSRDLTSFYSNEGNQMNDGSLLAVQAPATPSISQQRYLFNRANAVTMNNLWKIDKDYQLTTNINYINDRQEKDSYSRSEYYLPGDSLLKIEEKLSSLSHVNQLDGEVQLNSNSEKYYLNNMLKFSGKWNSDEGSAISSDSIYQDLDKPSYKINNTFQWIKNRNKSSLNVYSFNGYSWAPQSLIVNPVLYADLFDKSQNWQSMRQDLTQDYFSSSTKLTYGLDKYRWEQRYTFGVDLDIQHLESTLRPQSSGKDMGQESDSLKNDLQWNKYVLYFVPSYGYKYGQFQANASLPFSYNILRVNDKVPNEERNTNQFYINPSLTLKYKINAFLDLFGIASYRNSLGGITSGYTGYIMRTYRTLLKNDGKLPETQTQNYNLYFNYRHPIKELFGNVGVTYFNMRSNILSGYDYRGILSIKKTVDVPNTTEGIRLDGRISKGLDRIASTISLAVNYSNSSSSQISQDEIVKFKSDSYSLTPGITTRLRSWGSFSYRFRFSESKSTVENDASDFRPIRNTSQTAQFNVFPMKGLSINLGYEYFYNSAIAEGNRTMSFGDLGAKYKWKDTEFIFSYTNIFNSKQYISASYSDISTYYYAYDLRPAEVLLKVRFKLKGK